MHNYHLLTISCQFYQKFHKKSALLAKISPKFDTQSSHHACNLPYPSRLWRWQVIQTYAKITKPINKQMNHLPPNHIKKGILWQH
ncbi:hypothetical protein B0189_04995 [Moraxella cuniculi]|nr:hypothetical protein B0189_04995 [Moraxella cuniculi]